jgi:hypothetical protein
MAMAAYGRNQTLGNPIKQTLERPLLVKAAARTHGCVSTLFNPLIDA